MPRAQQLDTAGDVAPDAVRSADIPLERDLFVRMLVAQLAGVLEETVGFEDSAGYISMVGQSMGTWIGAQYDAALGAQTNPEHLAEVLVDLKRRINGDFHVISADEHKIVLGNRACPFGELVKGRPSLCMMTSNVFGSIASQGSGYAKVVIEEAIAQGDPGCRVVVWLDDDDASAAAEGREYFADGPLDR